MKAEAVLDQQESNKITLLSQKEFEEIWLSVLKEDENFVDIDKVRNLSREKKIQLIMFIVNLQGDILEDLIPEIFDMTPLINLGYTKMVKKGDNIFLTTEKNEDVPDHPHDEHQH